MSKESRSTSPFYRIYRMGFDGQFIDAEVLEASDDLEAITKARTKLDRYPIELWSGDRLMARLEPPES